jgi:hypothetical protein
MMFEGLGLEASAGDALNESMEEKKFAHVSIRLIIICCDQKVNERD